jgi:hypothetical protein
MSRAKRIRAEVMSISGFQRVRGSRDDRGGVEVDFKGATVKHTAGAGPGSGTVDVATLSPEQLKKLVDVRFKDELGNPWGGIEVWVEAPGKPDLRPIEIDAVSGALLIGGVEPGECKITFPCIKDPEGFGSKGS